MTNEVLKDALHAFIVDRSQLDSDKVIWSYQDAPRPVPTYLDMQIISGPMSVGGTMSDEILPDVGSASEKVVLAGQEVFTLQVRAFGSLAHDVIASIRRHMFGPFNYEDLLKKRKIISFTVGSVVVGASYGATFEGVPVAYVAVAGNTVKDIRDGLIAAINASDWMQDEEITASEGATTSKLNVQGRVGCDILVETLLRLTQSVTQEAVDISVIRELATTDITIDRDPGWEPALSLDIEMGCSGRAVFDGEFIEHIEIENEESGSVITIP